MSFQSISPSFLANKLTQQDSCVIVDVRTPAEFQGVHVQGANNVPIDSIDAASIQAMSHNGEKTIYILCQNGGRSQRACKSLSDAGVAVVNIEGGTTACIAAGLPVIRGKGVISLDRQVRIAAGSLVVLGVLLGYFVHPGCIALAAFVGAGLVFSGVTNTCTMAMILAKMPWNQVKS